MVAVWEAVGTPDKLLQSPHSVRPDSKAISVVVVALAVVVVASAAASEVTEVASEVTEAALVVTEVASVVIEAALADVVASATKAVAVSAVDKEATRADRPLPTRRVDPVEGVGSAVATKTAETGDMGQVGIIVEEQEATEIRSVEGIAGTKVATVIETGTVIETAIATEIDMAAAAAAAVVVVATEETTTLGLESDTTRATGMTTRESDDIDLRSSPLAPLLYYSTLFASRQGWLVGGYSMVIVFPLSFLRVRPVQLSSNAMVRTSCATWSHASGLGETYDE